jgi:signal peptidase II
MRVLWISAVVVLLDQATKAAILATMYRHQSIALIGDWLRLTFTENSGMAFGITVGPPGTVTVMALIATCLVGYYLWQVRTAYAPYRASLSLIFGGAVGNIIDRVFYAELLGYGQLFTGHVVDFIHVSLWQGFIPEIVPVIGGGYMELFPIWNVADMAIVVGVVGVLGFHHGFYEEMTDTLETPGADEGDRAEEGRSTAGSEREAPEAAQRSGAGSREQPGKAPGVPGTHPSANGRPPAARSRPPAGAAPGAPAPDADSPGADSPGADSPGADSPGADSPDGAGEATAGEKAAGEGAAGQDAAEGANAGDADDADGIPSDSAPPNVPDVRAPRGGSVGTSAPSPEAAPSEGPSAEQDKEEGESQAGSP